MNIYLAVTCCQVLKSVYLLQYKETIYNTKLSSAAYCWPQQIAELKKWLYRTAVNAVCNPNTNTDAYSKYSTASHNRFRLISAVLHSLKQQTVNSNHPGLRIPGPERLCLAMACWCTAQYWFRSRGMEGLFNCFPAEALAFWGSRVCPPPRHGPSDGEWLARCCFMLD